MNILRNKKFFPLYALLLLLIISPFLLAKNGWVGSGKSIALAWQNAFVHFLEKRYYNYQEKQWQIRPFIKANWRKYALGDIDNPQIIYRRGRRVQIKVQIAEKKLLKDIRLLMGCVIIEKAMDKFIRNTIRTREYRKDEDKIQKFIRKNWSRYVREDRLLQDVKELIEYPD